MNFKNSNLSLFRGRDLHISDNIYLKHPKLSEIEEIGEDKYNEYVSCICTSSIDVADILCFELNIWYEDIKDEWEFFIQRCVSNKSILVKNLSNNKIEYGCLVIDDLYRDSLNYFFNLNGEYIITEIKVDNLPQLVINNVLPYTDENGSTLYYILSKENFKFTKFFYELSKDFLDQINWMQRNYDYLKGGTKGAKKYILKNTLYKERKKNKKSTITLDSIVSSLVAKGISYNDIWNFPIYTIYDEYYRHIKIDEYNNTVSALYNGCIDTKKNPINWEKINWSNVIK